MLIGIMLHVVILQLDRGIQRHGLPGQAGHDEQEKRERTKVKAPLLKRGIRGFLNLFRKSPHNPSFSKRGIENRYFP